MEMLRLAKIMEMFGMNFRYVNYLIPKNLAQILDAELIRGELVDLSPRFRSL